ncbi:MAG: two-component regulator propeller domain-containing protein, partial [Vicinamibacterales bacterium]
VSRSAAALDPERSLAQYLRDQWGAERGFPGGPIYGLTQTADGYLWIACEKGLVRFDGLTFVLHQPAGLSAGIGPTVLGVAAAPDGSVWARLRGPALVRWRNGAFEHILSTIGLQETVITAMTRGPGDDLLLATLGRGGVSYRTGQFTTLTTPSSLPTTSFVIAMAAGADGTIWMGTRDAGLLRVHGKKVDRIDQGLPNQKVNCLLPVDAGELWIGTDHGVARWTGREVTQAGTPEAIRDITALAMIRDRDRNIWIAAAARGLIRITPQGVVSTLPPAVHADASVTALVEDREGNLWVGTTRGIERLRDGQFTTWSTTEGLPSDALGPIYVEPSGRVWFAPSSGGVFWLHDGVVGRPDVPGLHDDVVYSIAGRGGEVWLGRQRGGLTRLSGGPDGSRAQHVTQANGLAQNSVYAVHEARDGTVWAGTLSGGVSRIMGGQISTFTTASGLASNTVTSILEDAQGTLWFGTPNGISTLAKGVWRRFTAADGLPSNEVTVLASDADGDVWAGTTNGLLRFHDGRPEPLASTPAALRGSILGLAEDRGGTLWVSTADRLVRVNRRALLDAGSTAYVQEPGVVDGLLAIEGVKRQHTMVADGRGRIWFAMTRGLSMADPQRSDGRSVAALTHVEEVSSDGATLDFRQGLCIPPRSRRVSFAYTGLSLAVPERVTFRYRLDGFDTDWSAPVSDRQVAFTNLTPGPYVFRVVASNGDGTWSGQEAALAFEVAPSFWQTAWFQVTAMLAGVSLVWAAYRIRVARVASRLQLRFDERLAERTRIAQALHDTLLQGFISAAMQLHVAADRLPADSAARPSIDKVLGLMTRVLEEGRNAVTGLRSGAGDAQDLESAFAAIRDELAVPEPIEFRVIVEGKPRPLHPTLRDEVYRIGREALVNAFRHAEPQRVEIELDYSLRGLRLSVRDDGRGIDPDIVQSGRDGHWGLAGMRERAEAIGAAFVVRSRLNAGTEVELTVPGEVAFGGKG